MSRPHRIVVGWLAALALSTFVAPYRVETVNDFQRWIDGLKDHRTLPREPYREVRYIYAPLWSRPSGAQRVTLNVPAGVQVQADRAGGKAYTGVHVERVALDVVRYKWFIAGFTALALVVAARSKGEYLSSP
jgi:hypothetical protein